MKKQQLQEIARVYKDKVDRAAERLLAGEDVGADMEWLKAASEVLEAGRKIEAYEQSSSREWIWASVTVLVCLMIAGFLWFKPVGEVNVSMRIQSEAATFHLASPWTMKQPLFADRLQIEQLSDISSAALDIYVKSDLRDAWLEAEHGTISINTLGITPLDEYPDEYPSEEKGTLTLRSHKDEIDFISKGSHLNGSVSVVSESHLACGDESGNKCPSMPLNIRRSETIEFTSHGRGEASTQLRIQPTEDWRLNDLNIQRLDFLQRGVSSENKKGFVSAIKSGEIVVNDLPSKRIELFEGDRLLLQGNIGVERLEVSGGKTIGVFFKGTVEKLKLGPEHSEKNLAPSLLEYWYHNQPLAWFWSLVVLLFGLFGGIRKLFFPGRQ
jgi:hypothetical protein